VLPLLAPLLVLSVFAFAQDQHAHDAASVAALKQAWLAQQGGETEGDLEGGIAGAEVCNGNGANLFYPFSNTDGTWILALDGNDDGSTPLISLPFQFNFFGDSFPGLFINNNGNVTFGQSSSAYNSTGFPTQGPKMIAAFWADVDTRPAASGKVWRKSLDSDGNGSIDTFVVTWDNVGYYSNRTDKLNTFQIILTDGTNSSIGLGVRAAFSYDNMCWTTGSASGGSNGFGGGGATVGVNRGNGTDFFQVGRFNQPGSAYDGPGGAPDGIDYLDGKFFTLTLGGGGQTPNQPPICNNLPTGTVSLTVGQPLDLQLDFIPPELNQTTSVVVSNQSVLVPLGFTFTQTVSGSLTRLRIQWTPTATGVGTQSIQITATDNAPQPASRQFQVGIAVTPPTPINVQASDGTLAGLVRVTWTASPGATAYSVFRRLGSGSFTLLQTVGNVTQYDDTTAAVGQTYSYAVVALGGGLSSPQSAPDSGFVSSTAAPTGVSATDGTLTAGVKVSWQAVTGSTGYRVFRTVSGQSPIEVGSTTASTLFYTDSSAVPGVQLAYFVRATFAGGVLGSASLADGGWRAMTAPVGVTASDGASVSAVEVQWSSAAGAVGYRVLRSVGSEAPIQVGSVTGLSYSDTSAVPGASYSYSVRAVGALADAVSAPSAVNAGWRALSSPTGVQATDGTESTGVRVSWSAAAGAASYTVLRASVSQGVSGPTTQVASGITSLQFIDGSSAVGVLYRYSVRAVASDPLRVSASSATDDGFRLVAPPASVSASDGTSTAAVICGWSAVSGATSYTIHRRSGSAAFSQIASVTSALSWTDATASPGQSYDYAVAVVTPVGASQLSAPNAGYRMVGTPTGVQASDGTRSDGVLVQWSGVTGAQGFQVWRAVGQTAAVQIATVSSGSTVQYLDATAAPGVVYSYTVRAQGQVGVSPSSAGNTGFRQLAAPLGVAASDGTQESGVALSWQATAGAVSYQVFRSGTTAALGTVTAPATSFTDSTAAVGTQFSYTVKALGSATGVASALSSADTGYRNRARPQNAQASENIPAHVRVTWTLAAAGTPAVTGYEIRRVLGSETPVTLTTTLSATATQYDDTTAVPGTQYIYEVRARYTLLGSSPSIVVTTLAATDAGLRPVPAGSSSGGVAGGDEEGDGSGESTLTVGGDRVEASPSGTSTTRQSGGRSDAAGIAGAPLSDVRDAAGVDADGDGQSACGDLLRALEGRIAAAEAEQRAQEQLAALEVLREMMVFTRVESDGQVAQWTEAAVCARGRGDVNLDGVVDAADLSLFMNAWQADDEVIADLDRDGSVSARDVAQMLAGFGGE